MRRTVTVVALGASLALAVVANASAGMTEDHAQRALNILPSGQYGNVPPPTRRRRGSRR